MKRKLEVRKMSQYKTMSHKVATWTDALGTRVDKGIIKIVSLLNLLGFRTVQSCEGHVSIDHGLPLPWVDIEINGNKRKEKELRNLIRSYWSYTSGARESGIFGMFIYDDRLPNTIRIQPSIDLFYSVKRSKNKIPSAVLHWYFDESKKEMKRFEKYLWLRYLGKIRGVKNPDVGTHYH